MRIKKNNLLKKFSLALCCLLLSVVFSTNLRAQSAYLITPGASVGSIRRNSSEAELKRIYGRANVRDAKVSLGEGEYEAGTVIYPDDPTRKIEIIWKDAAKKRFPRHVYLTGRKSVWKTRSGISLGTNLKDLERINGKPFTLLGFGWDYAGTIVSWKGGKLRRELKDDNQTVTIRLGESTYKGISEKELNSIMGDIEFSSGNSVMRRVNPRIYQIIVEFP